LEVVDEIAKVLYVLQATSCENNVGLEIDRKHWAPVVQLSVATVMFFCIEYCTNSKNPTVC